MFGEVYDADRAVTSSYVTQGKLQATLDFPFQAAARSYVVAGRLGHGAARRCTPTTTTYTDADTNAYELPTFLGNHDMGRIGYFLQADNPGAATPSC